MKFKPCLSSFFSSMLLAISLILTASIVTFFLVSKISWWLWVLDIIMCLFSLLLIAQAIYVHFQVLEIYDDFLILKTPLFAIQMHWHEIQSAVLRERKNAMSRTDRLLIVSSSKSMLNFNISTLNIVDEGKILKIVKSKIHLEIIQDSPCI